MRQNEELLQKNIKKQFEKIQTKLKNKTSDNDIVGLVDFDKSSLDDEKIPMDAELRYGQLLDSDYDYGSYQLAKTLLHEIERERRDRVLRYQKIDKAIEHPEIGGALNIYADEATTENEEGLTVMVNSENEELKQSLEELFDVIGFNSTPIWEIAKQMCAYGDEFGELIFNKKQDAIIGYERIPRETIERVEENGKLIGYRPVDLTERQDMNVSFDYTLKAKTAREKKSKLVHPFRVVHWRIDSSKYGIYGESILEPVLNSIDELRLMEKSLLINRLVRSPERRIYNVNVGNLQGENAVKYARMAVRHDGLKKKKIIDAMASNSEGSSKADIVTDILSTTEDIILPFKQGQEKNSIEALPGLQAPGEVGDLEFIRDRIFPGIGIPRQYLFDDQFANANLNLSSKNIHFAKKIRRVQRFLIAQMYHIAIIHMILKGYKEKDFDNFEILMINPSTINERETLEIETQRWSLIGQITALLQGEKPLYPNYYIYKNILKLSDDSIAELIMLNELQASGKSPFEAMAPEDRPESAKTLSQMLNTDQEENTEGEEGEGEIPSEAAEALGEPPKEDSDDDDDKKKDDKDEEQAIEADAIEIDFQNPEQTRAILEEQVKKAKNDRQKQILEKKQKVLQEYYDKKKQFENLQEEREIKTKPHTYFKGGGKAIYKRRKFKGYFEELEKKMSNKNRNNKGAK